MSNVLTKKLFAKKPGAFDPPFGPGHERPNVYQKGMALTMKSCVMALGMFDGVHLGHLRVLSAAADIAEQLHIPLYVLTFRDHPRTALGTPTKLICSTEEKIARLKAAGADEVIALPFASVRDLSPEGFIYYAIGQYGARFFVCGADYRFGKNGAGDVKTLEKLCAECGKGMKSVAFATDETGEKISSRAIREKIEQGDCEGVRATLGRYFSIESSTVHGKGLAHQWGTPTINQVLPDDMLLPKYGVYATLATVAGKCYPAVTNVGIRPTFADGNTPTVETYLLDGRFSEIQNVCVEFVRFLRSERPFADAEALQKQIHADAETADALLRPMLDGSQSTRL